MTHELMRRRDLAAALEQRAGSALSGNGVKIPATLGAGYRVGIAHAFPQKTPNFFSARGGGG